MRYIVPGILTLDQHLKSLNAEPELYRPKQCPYCGMGSLRSHGNYYRKSDRDGEVGYIPIPIPRFFCPYCHKTCSALPECIAPKRWYVWRIQQMALSLLLAGESFRTIAKKILPSRSTISRWFSRFKERFRLHQDTLCNHCGDLGLTKTVEQFWPVCFAKISLAKAMYLCNIAGVNIP
jgi:transposase-like protein